MWSLRSDWLCNTKGHTSHGYSLRCFFEDMLAALKYVGCFTLLRTINANQGPFLFWAAKITPCEVIWTAHVTASALEEYLCLPLLSVQSLTPGTEIKSRFVSRMTHYQAVENRTNMTSRAIFSVVVDFHGPQNRTVDTNDTVWHHVRSIFHSLLTTSKQDRPTNSRCGGLALEFGPNLTKPSPSLPFLLFLPYRYSDSAIPPDLSRHAISLPFPTMGFKFKVNIDRPLEKRDGFFP